MKKNFIFALLISALITLMFAGCADGETPGETARAAQTSSSPSAVPLASAVDKTDMTAENSQPSDTADNSSAQNSPSDNSAIASNEPDVAESSAVPANYNVSDYEDRIVDLIARMDKAEMNDYKPLKKEARQINDELDRTEDLAEIDYYNGKISNSDYIQIERELEILEEMLDHAEDSMEFRLGIDD